MRTTTAKSCSAKEASQRHLRRSTATLDLVDMVTARFARADRGVDRLGLINVDDMVATVSRCSYG